MGSYREHALEGASAVELVVALYDGILRFLHAAIDAVDRGDAEGRRAAVKRALDIVLHLQARLRMDVGGRPAQALSEFYASIFAQIVQASQGASKAKFIHAIGCVRNVRDAWREVAREENDRAARAAAARVVEMPQRKAALNAMGELDEEPVASGWTA